jgi:HEAT repeat protein
VIRPVRTPILLKDFLTNYDLIAADIAVLDESQVEREICSNLTDELLVATANAIIKDVEKLAAAKTEQLPSGEKVSDVKVRHVAALRDVAHTLCERGSEMEFNFVESLVRQNVLSLDELPPEIRAWIETRHLADAFLAHREQYLGYLRNPTAVETVQKLAATVYRIAPDLLLRSRYDIIAEILEVVRSGQKQPRTARFFDQLATFLVKAISDDAVVNHLLQDLRRLDKEHRGVLVDVLVFSGEVAVPGLLTAYADTPDKGVRLSAFEALKKIGAKALQPFLAQLPKLEDDWAMIRHVLAEVGEAGEPKLAEALKGYAHHSSVHVRHACLNALFKLLGPEAETYLLAALYDSKPEVRQAAVAHLSEIRSRKPQIIEFYRRALTPGDGASAQESDAVLIEVCRALGRIDAADVAAAEALLLDAIRPRKAKGVLAVLKKSASPYSERVQEAVCQTLGQIGTTISLETLRSLENGAAAVAAAARAAIQSIEARAHS